MLVTAALFALVTLGNANSHSLTATRFALEPKLEHQPSVHPTAPHVVSLGSTPRTQRKKALVRAATKNSPIGIDVTSLSTSEGDIEYLAPITVGGQDFKVIVDTGSSDTWLAHNGFQCISSTTNKATSESDCAFGPTYSTRASKTFQGIGGKNFNITYADLEFLVGDVAHETVTLAGLTVKSQIIGVVNKASWHGDGINSGLVGLAFPFITSVFNTTDPTKDSQKNHYQYNPFFLNAIAEKAVRQPVFSIALNRGTLASEQDPSEHTNKGFLGFGGTVPVNVTSSQTTVPIQGVKVGSSSKTAYVFYTVDASYIFSGVPAHSNTSAILDSGTTLNYLPTKIAAAYNAKFSPPATFDKEHGAYTVDCNAKAPAFSIGINGVSFPIAAADQILPGWVANGKLVCMSGTQDGGDPSDPNNTFVLGDVFLHNVVATFNLVANTIKLAARAPY